MDLERVMVTDLIQELEACHPRRRGPHRPAAPWPFADAIDPATAAVQLDLGGPSVVDLGQGAQLGDLPGPVRAQPGW